MSQRTRPFIDNTKESLNQYIEVATGDGVPIVVKKAVLITKSSKLMSLLQNTTDNRIRVPEVTKPIMEILINYLQSSYTGNSTQLDISDGNIYDLSKAAKGLKLEEVVEQCREYVDAAELTPENCALYLHCALLLSCDVVSGDQKHLVKKTLDFLIKNICAVSKKNARFASFPLNVIKRILAYNRAEDITQENVITEGICNWVQIGKRPFSECEELLKEFMCIKNQVKIITTFFEKGTENDKTNAIAALKKLCSQENDQKRPIKTEFPTVSPSPSSSGYKLNGTAHEEDQYGKGIFDHSISTSANSHSPPKRLRLENCETNDTSWIKKERVESDEPPFQPHVFHSEGPRVVSTASLFLSTESNNVSLPPNTTTNTTSGQLQLYFIVGDLTSSVITSLRQIWSYNLKTQECKHVAKISDSELRFCRSLSLVYYDGEVYFLGGEVAYSGTVTRKVHVLNLKTKKWRTLDMVSPRYEFQSVVVNEHIYAVGGCEEDERGPEIPGVAINLVEKLKLSKVRGQIQRWEEADDYMIRPRSEAGICTLNGNIYAIGGLVPTSKHTLGATNACECCFLDRPPDNQWTHIAPLKFSRLGLVAVAVPSINRIYAIGGKSFANETEGLKYVEIYDIETDTWTLGPPLSVGRTNFSGIFHNGSIYVFGGDSRKLPTLEKLDITTGTWTIVGPLKIYGDFSSVAFQAL